MGPLKTSRPISEFNGFKTGHNNSPFVGLLPWLELNQREKRGGGKKKTHHMTQIKI